VARLEDKRFHVPILVAAPFNFLRTGLQLRDDRPRGRAVVIAPL
jgi:hypothetical protein